jgi:hypothetical protein
MADETGGVFDGLKSFISEFGSTLAETFKANFNTTLIVDTIQEVDLGAKEVAKSFGLGAESVLEIKTAMADAVKEVAIYGKTFTDIANLQQRIGESVGRNIIMSTDNYAKLFATSQVTGQDASRLVKDLKDAGISLYNVNTEMQSVIDSAREMGVNASVVTTAVLNNLDKLNTYNFSNGVEGLARMAAFATATRTDMREVFAFSEKVYNPEGAIQTAAALQRLGVAQTDLLNPLRLMDLSANDPEELQKQISELGRSFVELNEKGKFQIAPGEVRRLREISKELGIGYNEMVKMSIGGAELERKLTNIKFPDFVSEEQKMLISNMAEMKDGKYVIQYQGEERDVSEVLNNLPDKDAFDKLIESGRPKSIEELAKEQVSYLDQINRTLLEAGGQIPYAIAATKTATDTVDMYVKGTQSVYKGMTSIPQKDIRETLDKTSMDIINTLTKAVKGEAGISDVLMSISEAGSETANLLNTGFKTGLENTIEGFKKISESNNSITNLLTAMIEKLGKTVLEVENIDPSNITVTNPIPQANIPLNVETITPTTTQQTMTTTQNSNISLNLTLSAPPNVDTAQLEKILKDPMFQQKMTGAINMAMNNQNLTIR